MSPMYTLIVDTKARGSDKKNLMNMLSNRFPSPYIVKRHRRKTLFIYGHEDDEDVANRIQIFVDYAIEHFPHTKVTACKGFPKDTTESEMKEVIGAMGVTLRYREVE